MQSLGRKCRWQPAWVRLQGQRLGALSGNPMALELARVGIGAPHALQRRTPRTRTARAIVPNQHWRKGTRQGRRRMTAGCQKLCKLLKHHSPHVRYRGQTVSAGLVAGASHLVTQPFVPRTFWICDGAAPGHCRRSAIEAATAHVAFVSVGYDDRMQSRFDLRAPYIYPLPYMQGLCQRP